MEVWKVVLGWTLLAGLLGLFAMWSFLLGRKFVEALVASFVGQVIAVAILSALSWLVARVVAGGWPHLP